MDANELKELTDHLNARYVRKDDCPTRHERTEAEITIDNKDYITDGCILIEVEGATT